MMQELDTLLNTAAMPVQVSDQLMARILADAAREQPVQNPFGVRAAAAVPKSGFSVIWDSIADLFGGGGVVAGLASVACAGVYLGAAQPSMISTLSLALSGSVAVEQLDYMPSIDALLAEE
jgi:hypothetical protein